MTRLAVSARDIRPNDTIDGASVTYVRELRCGYVIVRVNQLSGIDRTRTYPVTAQVTVRRFGGR